MDRRKFLARTSQAGTAVAGALTVGGITTESVDPAMRAAQAAMLRRAHAHTPAEKLLPQTRQFINLADHDATEATDQQRPALLRALAEGHLLAATMYASEARDDTRAQRHIRQALDAAKQAGREQAGKVWVLALAKYAQLPEYADRPGLGVVSINGADQRLHGAPAPVASYVHLVSAEQHAKLGERRTAEAKLEQARQELIGVDADAPWDGVGVWGGVRALGYEGAVLRRFGRPTEAYQRMLTWRDQVPAGLPKHKLMAELELADTALDWGDVDLSTGHARAALLGARRTGYASTVGQVRALVDGRLAPYGKHPAVTELRDMLRVA